MPFKLKDRLEAVFGADYDPRNPASSKIVSNVEKPVVHNEKPSKRDITPSTNLTSTTSTFSSAPSNPPAPTTPATPLQPETSLNAVHKNLVKRFKTDESLIRIQPGKGDAGSEPLILIHDGSGISVKFGLIKPLNRELWGISNPKTFTEDTWDGLDAMASAYAAKIATTIAGPCIIGGWSFGGVVAFRAAQILLANKHPIKGVILIDSPPPLDHQPLPTAMIDAIMKPPDNKSSDTQKALNSSLRRQFITNTGMLAIYRPAHNVPTPKMFLLRSSEGYDLSSLPCEYNAWLEDRSDPRSAVEGWEKVVGGKVDIIDIPGNHFEVFEAKNIEGVSNAIDKACKML